MAYSSVSIQSANLKRAAGTDGNPAIDASGRLYMPVNTLGTLSIEYSDDDGATWTPCTLAGTTQSLINGDGYPMSMFITNNGDMLFAYTNSGAYHRVTIGTISGTTITFASPLASMANNSYHIGKVVGFHDGASTTYIFYQVFDAATSRLYLYNTKSVGAASPTVSESWITITDGTTWCVGDVDFEHTGDGRTPAVTYPDIYVTYQKQHNYIYWRTYANDGDQTFTAGTQYTLHTTGSYPSGPQRGHWLRFDGTDCYTMTASTATPYIIVHKVTVAGSVSTLGTIGASASGDWPQGMMLDSPTGDVIIMRTNSAYKQWAVNRWSVSGGAWDGWTNTYVPSSSRAAYNQGLHAYDHGRDAIGGWAYEYVDGTTQELFWVDVDEIALERVASGGIGWGIAL